MRVADHSSPCIVKTTASLNAPFSGTLVIITISDIFAILHPVKPMTTEASKCTLTTNNALTESSKTLNPHLGNAIRLLHFCLQKLYDMHIEASSDHMCLHYLTTLLTENSCLPSIAKTK